MTTKQLNVLQNIANDRIIAAAPQILAALQGFISQCDQYAIGEIPSGFHDMAKYGRAAITKATGQ